MKYDRFQLRLSSDLKDKLIRDSLLHNFSTPTAYLQELIKKGLPLRGALDARLQLVEKKLDSLTSTDFVHNEKTEHFLDRVFKKLSVTYKIAAFTLARTFFIKPGNISQDEADHTKAYIDEQVRRIGDTDMNKL